MTIKDFLRDRKRMCKSLGTVCSGCPAYAIQGEINCKLAICSNVPADEQMSIVHKWSLEHPLVTRQDVFLKQYPGAELNPRGILVIDPCALQKTYRLKQCCGLCDECRKEYWLGEVDSDGR